MALAGAVCYVIVDFLKKYLGSGPFIWLVSIVIFVVLYKVANHYLKSLKE